jgi:hypothetical protein
MICLQLSVKRELSALFKKNDQLQLSPAMLLSPNCERSVFMSLLLTSLGQHQQGTLFETRPYVCRSATSRLSAAPPCPDR